MAKQFGNFYVPSEAKLAFVIRIRGYVCLKGLYNKSIKIKIVLGVFQYQWCESKSAQDLAAFPTSTNQQWCVCEAKQSNIKHAKYHPTLCCLWVSLSFSINVESSFLDYPPT